MTKTPRATPACLGAVERALSTQIGETPGSISYRVQGYSGRQVKAALLVLVDQRRALSLGTPELPLFRRADAQPASVPIMPIGHGMFAPVPSAPGNATWARRRR